MLRNREVNRRKFLQYTSALSLALGLARVKSTSAAENNLVFVGWGGSYQDAQRKAHFEPFKQATGADIVEIPGGPKLAKLKAQVDSGSVEWSVVDLEASDMLRAGREGLLEPIDTTVVDTSDIISEGVNEYGVMNVTYSTIFGYNTNAFPPGAPRPIGWTGFWDVDNFPGPRCLKDTPKGALEAALIADGVPKDKLYPLDIDRAFKSLDHVKPHIAAWYSGPAQAVQLLASGEIILVATSHNRLGAAIADGGPIDMDWTDGRLDSDFWAVPKGTPQKDLAMQFIASAIGAQQQADMARYSHLGPSNVKAVDFLSEEELARLPSGPERMQGQFWTDNGWWLENEGKLIERWETWKLA